MRDSFVNKIHKLASNDSEIYLLTADLGFGIFDRFAREYPKQYLNVGVAEQLMVGVAVGMALEGAKVIVYSIGNFATFRCLEQIRNDAAYHDVNITVVASGGGFTYGQLGMSHHATEDLSIMRSIPNVDVFVPASKPETDLILDYCINSSKVSYLRLEKSAIDACPINNSPLQFGKLIKYRDGEDVTIVAVGGLVNEAILASDLLSKNGIRVSVIGCHSLKPFDVEGILELVKSSKILLSLEEHSKIGGLRSAIADVCLDYGVYPRKFHSFGMADCFSTVVGDQNYLRKFYKLDSAAIQDYILQNI